MPGTLRWLGLAFVEFTTNDNHVILFDPWTKSAGNPSCPIEQVMPMHFEWNANPAQALENFMRFCRQKAPDVHIIEPVAGKHVNLM